MGYMQKSTRTNPFKLDGDYSSTGTTTVFGSKSSGQSITSGYGVAVLGEDHVEGRKRFGG